MQTKQGSRLPNFYILSEEGYEALKELQSTLTSMIDMTHMAKRDMQRAPVVVVGLNELHTLFATINEQVDTVLERLGNENWIGPHRQTPQ